jgi:hypothetical protein
VEQSNQIQKVFTLVGKAIHFLKTREKWNLFEELNRTLKASTATGQWTKLNEIIPTVRAAAEQEQNADSLAKLTEATEVRDGYSYLH